MAEPFPIEIGIPNWFRRPNFHVLEFMINVLGSAHEKFGIWTGPKALTEVKENH